MKLSDNNAAVISFIVPAKNEQAYIADCLASIKKEAAGKPHEIIVVDNGSTDKTALIVKEKFPGARVVFEAERGTNRCRQRGLEEARGDVLIFLDADNRLPSGWLGKALSKLYSDSRIVAVSGPYKFYDFPWYWNLLNEVFMFGILLPWSVVFFNWLRWGAQMVGGNSVIKKFALDKIGGFDISYKFYGDDTETAMRLKKIGQVFYDPRYWIYSSARRYEKKGVLKTTAVYIFSFFRLLFKRRPKDTDSYEMIR